MDTKLIGTWSFLIGLVLALATAFVDLGSWATQVLILLGILVGIFHAPLKEKLVLLGVSYLVLIATANTVSELALLGSFISNIATAWAGFLGIVALTAFLFWGAPMLIGNKED